MAEVTELSDALVKKLDNEIKKAVKTHRRKKCGRRRGSKNRNTAEELRKKLAELTNEFNDVRRSRDAIRSIINRLEEIKWISSRYGIDNIMYEADNMIKDVINTERKLDEEINLLYDEMNSIRMKLNKLIGPREKKKSG